MTGSPESRSTHTYNFTSPVDHPPRRVVSLVPSVTESLFDLQIGDRLVAVTDYCVHPSDGVARLPKVGGTKNPDLEKIIALRPDLVILNREENRREDAERLQAAGIPIWVTHPQTVQDALNLLWEIMYVFDAPAMAERVRWIERQVDWTAGVARESKPVRVFVPIWYDPWMTFDRHTYIHDLLRVCGGENVFADYPTGDTHYPCITPDEIVAAQPEVILLPDEPFAFSSEHADQLSRLDVPAARRGRIYPVEGSLLTWHGTRLARALREIPPLLAQSEEE